LCFFSFLTEDMSFEESFLLLAGLQSSISSKVSGKSGSKIWEEIFVNSAINLRVSFQSRQPMVSRYYPGKNTEMPIGVTILYNCQLTPVVVFF
jgi:hypothetical protein